MTVHQRIAAAQQARAYVMSDEWTLRCKIDTI
jgi:hypothetical protein